MTAAIWIRGLTPYAACHAWQRRLTELRAEGVIDDVIVLVEHAPVITVGKQRNAATHVLDPGDTPVIDVERGGGPTWHGPGQLVAYPIVQLHGERRDLHRHLHALEDAVTDTLAGIGLTAGRDARNTGVWLDCADGERRKVCSIGIACRSWVTWHGLALNVNPDWLGFQRIHPCGFDASVMTRLVDHRPELRLDDLAEPLARSLSRRLDLDRPRFAAVPNLSAAIDGLDDLAGL
jgi:lipoyl(octanoyl) transferase